MTCKVKVFWALLLFNTSVFAQENCFLFDSVIPIQEVTVYAKQKMEVLSNKKSRNVMHIRGYGNASIVSKVNLNKDNVYHIKAVEFFFNYNWSGLDNEGFYIKPIIKGVANGKPSNDLINSQCVYFVGNNINEEIYINLSHYNIVLENTDSFFVGFELVSASENANVEDFNITMVPVKNSQNISYLKGSCSKCDFSAFNLDEKNALQLKYKIYYK